MRSRVAGLNNELNYDRVSAGGISWLVAGEYQEQILIAFNSGWRDGKVLRETPRRRVLRVNGTRPLLVKHFHDGGVTGVLKTLLNGTPAALEWKALKEAQERGLPSATPLAFGQRQRLLHCESVIVAESLETATPLQGYLFGPGRLVGGKRWQAIREAAALIRKAHDLGVYQRDLHLGNILVREAGDGFEAFLIDFQRVTITASISPRMRRRNLAVLHGGCTEASRTDRLRFLKRYLSGPAPLPFDLRRLLVQLERKGLRHRFNLWRSRQKRCLAENREFVPIQAGAFFGFARKHDWDKQLLGLLREPDRVLQRSDAKIIKDSTTATVAVVGYKARRLFIKRYNYQGVGYVFKDLFRSSRARRVWLAANSCVMREVSVSLPVVYLERRRWRFLLESYVITEAVDGETLSQSLRHHLGDFRHKRDLMQDLAHFLRRMHDRQVEHRDLKAENIILQQEENGRCKFYIVDFDGFYIGAIFWRRRMKNLARLVRALRDHTSVTRTDCLRFLKAYLRPQEARRQRKMWRHAVTAAKLGR